MSVARILESVGQKQVGDSVDPHQRERKAPEWREVYHRTKEIRENFSVNFKLEQSGPKFRFSVVNRDGRPTGIFAKADEFDLVKLFVIEELHSASERIRAIDAEFQAKQAEREAKRNGFSGTQKVRSTGKTQRDREKKGIKKV